MKAEREFRRKISHLELQIDRLNAIDEQLLADAIIQETYIKELQSKLRKCASHYMLYKFWRRFNIPYIFFIGGVWANGTDRNLKVEEIGAGRIIYSHVPFRLSMSPLK